MSATETSSLELNKVLSKLQQQQNIFLTGGAGVGKTTITKAIINNFEEVGKKVAKLASTGMAATLIGGQTLHSFLDLGICDSQEDLERRGKLEPKKRTKKIVHAIDLMVIDEISMVSDALMQMIQLRLVQCDFNGVILLVGDFLQLPPVSRGNANIAFAFESMAWEDFGFETVILTHNYRTSDADFTEVLNAVRFGNVGEEEHYYLHHLIKPVGEDLSKYTYLYGKNISAQRHNKEQLEFIDSDEMTYEAQVIRHDKAVKDQEIERFFNDARVDPNLQLKVGAPILFTRNAWNYHNGERGRVIKMSDNVLHVEKADGVVVKLERSDMSKTTWKEKTIEGKKEFVEVPVFTLYQFPVALGFAITIHKSQGMSIDDLIIETTEIFAPSQFYVALSRATSPHRLILKQPNTNWVNLAFVSDKAKAFVLGE